MRKFPHSIKTLICLSICLCIAISGNAQSLPKPDHIVIVILENSSYEVVMEQKNAKYFSKLLQEDHVASFSNSFALKHPSQPNYLYLFSGSRQGVDDDSVPKNLYFTTPNLGASLLSKGLSFAGYSEGIPTVGFNGEKYDRFVRRHCPWINWQGSAQNGIPADLNKSYKDFPKDYSQLPTVSFVIPDLDHDMHEPANTFGAIINGDKWIRKNLTKYIEWAKSHNSLLIITFDEDDNMNNNHIPTLVIGEKVKKGIYPDTVNHLHVLRTILDMYGLEPIGKCKDVEAIRSCWE